MYTSAIKLFFQSITSHNLKNLSNVDIFTDEKNNQVLLLVVVIRNEIHPKYKENTHPSVSLIVF